MFKRNYLSPLIQAVVQNNLSLVLQLCHTQWQDTRDHYGFNALEIAYLLNRKECQHLLSPLSYPPLLVQYQNQPEASIHSIQQIEQRFQLQYCPTLTFSSYTDLKLALKLCPYLLRLKWLNPENPIHSSPFDSFLSFLQTAKVSVRWIDNSLGYGLFCEEECPKGTYIAEYTGNIRFLNKQNPLVNAYCLEYPVKAFSPHYAVIDALKAGNITRFINHSQDPNLDHLCLVDRGLIHQIFITNRHLKANTQLTCNYGEDYWQRRKQLANSSQELSRFAKLLDTKKQESKY